LPNECWKLVGGRREMQNTAADELTKATTAKIISKFLMHKRRHRSGHCYL